MSDIRGCDEGECQEDSMKATALIAFAIVWGCTFLFARELLINGYVITSVVLIVLLLVASKVTSA